jgi:hypothetical protein
MKMKRVMGGVAMAVGLGAGCGGAGAPGSPAPGTPATPTSSATTSPSTAAVDASIAQSLDTLRSLQIFGVGGLILNLPEEATACYNLPCPGSEWVEPYHAERARQAPRLAGLAAAASAASETANLTPAPLEQTADAIDQLASLQIVQVTGLIETQPANNPQCYNLPCQSDKDAAAAQTELTLAKAFQTIAILYRNE